MAQPKRIPPKAGKPTGKARAKKNSQPTQHPPQQRVKILGANGKTRFEWRPW